MFSKILTTSNPEIAKMFFKNPDDLWTMNVFQKS